MAGLTQEQLELENQNMKQILWMSDLILNDDTRSGSEAAAYVEILIGIAKRNLKEWTQQGRKYNVPIYRINYADGRKGYALFDEENARSTAVEKCWFHGGSYTIEEMKKDPQSGNSEGSKK